VIVMRDRCEVCQRVLEHRPVKKLRRCADHLDQLALVALTEVKRLARWRGSR
jgi:hypothetical protein